MMMMMMMHIEDCIAWGRIWLASDYNQDDKADGGGAQWHFEEEAYFSLFSDPALLSVAEVQHLRFWKFSKNGSSGD